MQGSGRFSATHGELKYVSLSESRSLRIWASISVSRCGVGAGVWELVFGGEEGDDDLGEFGFDVVEYV